MVAFDTTKEEALLLARADKEMFFNGHTDIVCPRCGNAIVCEGEGNSYVIRCKTDGCILETVRGI
ncbi:MAG: hypothetical protein LBT21_04295 [Oscillospiraceae bacterium]|jgi:hypothetical protein|nr:hypothetical protein [Oscillospiraceae bacterium]